MLVSRRRVRTAVPKLKEEMGELRDGEDIDEVEKQLHRGDALRIRARRAEIPPRGRALCHMTSQLARFLP